jgi:hypothetical protein
VKFEKILVVGLDGLDHEKIRAHGCENLMQRSFGRLGHVADDEGRPKG